jgi:hypothetical protein
MNAMLVYVMAAAGIFEGFLNGWYYDGTNNTLVSKEHIIIVRRQCTTSIDRNC